jgi:formamidopyrimidine-DNA glycosylase
MPELPDVEIFRRYFNSTALHQKIDSVKVSRTRILKDISPRRLQNLLKGKSFTSTDRHGKNLLIHFDSRILRMHFGMTGFLKYFKDQNENSVHTRLLITFKNNYKLAFVCQRMFGKVSLEKDIQDFVTKNNLGSDALKLNFRQFAEIFSGSKSAIKSLLLDQKKIAGLGNIYADEVLFQSKVHPAAKSGSLDKNEIKRIHHNIRKVLRYAIKHNAQPRQFAKSYLLPNRSRSGKCPRCPGRLKTVKISGRTSYFCPRSQKLKRA